MTARPLPTEARDTFLAHFSETKRGTVANWFLLPIRDGHIDPQVAVAHVIGQLTRRRDAAWTSEHARAEADFTIATIQTFRAEALAFAAYYIAYERLPAAERAALKERERAQHRDAWMAGNAPSDRQIAYLRRLGYTGPAPTTMRAASDAIDQLLTARGTAVRK